MGVAGTSLLPGARFETRTSPPMFHREADGSPGAGRHLGSTSSHCSEFNLCIYREGQETKPIYKAQVEVFPQPGHMCHSTQAIWLFKREYFKSSVCTLSYKTLCQHSPPTIVLDIWDFFFFFKKILLLFKLKYS